MSTRVRLGDRAKLQVPPLRYAPVGMTNLMLMASPGQMLLLKNATLTLSSREAVTFFISALRPVPHGRLKFLNLAQDAVPQALTLSSTEGARLYQPRPTAWVAVIKASQG
jgi:hypothetical protein